MVKKTREANLELLRILAMFMVISLHYLGKGGALTPIGEIAPSNPNFANEILAWVLEVSAYGAVNIYIMISGYFLINSTGKMERPFKIVVQVLFYSIGIYLIFLCMGRLPEYATETFYKCLFFLPIASSHYWFASSYVFFCLLAPFIAVGLRRLDEKQHRGLMIIMLLLFSRIVRILLPQTEPMDMDDKGYGIRWFFTLFVVASYIRRFVPVVRKRRWLYLGIFFLSNLVTLLSFFAIQAFSVRTGRFEALIQVLLEYNSPTIIASSVSLLLFFRTIRIPEGGLSGIIRFLSPLTFGIYLLHEHMLLRDALKEIWHVDTYFKTPLFILHFLGLVLFVFSVGACIEWIRRTIFDLLYRTRPCRWFFSKLGKMDRIFPKKDDDFKGAGDFLANENIGKIYYSAVPRAKQSAECIAGQHSTKVEMIEDPLVIDISWGIYEGKTYQEAFGDEKGGDYMFHPEKLIIPEGETFYSVMSRLRLFFVKFWESDEDTCTIVSHGAITNILSLMFLQAPLEKFWSMYMSACGVSKVQMKSIYSFTIEYWNANHFLKEGEKKYLKK